MEHRLKVVAYAIAKNESKHVDRWVKSVSEADEIYVLDTGSSDNTLELLEERGVHVKRHVFNPWRFDDARNMSLDMVPEDADVCVCTDLDEVFKPGWREEVEKLWKDGVTKIRYRINCSLDSDGNPLTYIYITKIHARKNYKWFYPIHENIKHVGSSPEKIVESSEITLNHYPDKTKPRDYLSLIEMATKEDPTSSRNLYLLSRSYCNNQKWEECIETVKNYLKLDRVSYVEKGSCLRYMARSYKNLGRYEEAIEAIDKSIESHKESRDNKMEKAKILYFMKKYKESIEVCEKALEIDFNSTDASKESIAFDSHIYDFMATCYFKLEDYINALYYSDKAIVLSPSDQNIKDNNKKIFHKYKEGYKKK